MRKGHLFAYFDSCELCRSHQVLRSNEDNESCSSSSRRRGSRDGISAGLCTVRVFSPFTPKDLLQKYFFVIFVKSSLEESIHIGIFHRVFKLFRN